MMYLGDKAVGLATTFFETSWKVKHTTTESTLNNAAQVSNWIQSVLPVNTVAIIIRDDYQTNPKTNGTLKIATFYGTTPGICIRNRDGNEGTVPWASNYDLGFSAGDGYTIYYQEVTPNG